ncbi:type IV toxin-antitoxin system AbiEi family antitoxin domain-containing protein [Sphingobium sp. 15-1]|uniref:type IV toxin-antitoxin system AbiEi family antitoxin domain-containing protein n=1 Tax=unclassified Sphingobium TaxID=2611147 RepID=UPI003510026E
MGKRDRDRAERAKLRGAKLSLRERAVALAKKGDEIRTKNFANIGVHRYYLARMCDEGLLVKVGYGRYRATPG